MFRNGTYDASRRKRNQCKGHNDCKTADNACKGMGSCKGQGFVMLPSASCGHLGGSTSAA